MEEGTLVSSYPILNIPWLPPLVHFIFCDGGLGWCAMASWASNPQEVFNRDLLSTGGVLWAIAIYFAVWESLLPVFTLSWWNTISPNCASQPVWSLLTEGLCLPLKCIWAPSSYKMTLKLHLSCILISVSGLWIADMLAARWPFWWADCPLRDLWVSEEDTWNPKWKGSEEGGIPPLLHQLPKSRLPFHRKQHLSYLFICLPFLNVSFRHWAFWNHFLFFFLFQCVFEPALSFQQTWLHKGGHQREGGCALLVLGQSRDKALENIQDFGCKNLGCKPWKIVVALGKYPLQPHVSFHISMNITRKEQNVNNFKDRTMYLMNKTQIPFSTLQWMMLLGANQHRAP